MPENDAQKTLIDLQMELADLRLKLAQKEADLDDTLYVIYCVLQMLGLNFENIRSASLKQVIKGVNSMIFKATADQEAFAEEFTGFWELAVRIAAKYEQKTKEIVQQRDAEKQ
jgi:hypothetical protein